MKKNKGALGLIAAVVCLGLYLAWDYSHEESETKAKDSGARIFTLQSDQVNEFLIENGAGKTRVVRTVDGWKIEEPVKDWADNAFTDDFVTQAMNDKMIEVAKEGDSIDLKLYGLDPAIGKITFKSSAGASQTLEISAKQNFEQNAIARKSGENRVIVVPALWSVNVGRTAQDFRDKKLFRHKLASIDHIDLKNENGGFAIVFEKGLWSMPEHKEWVLDQNRVHELMSMLSETKVKEFIADHAALPEEKKPLGLDQPAVTLRLISNEKPWAADMGRTQDKSEIASISDPAYTLKLENGSLDKFEKVTAESLRDHHGPFKFEKSLAQNMELQTPIKTSKFEKKDANWELSPPEDGVQADSAKVKDVIEKLQDFGAVQYATKAQTASFKPKNKLILSAEPGHLIFQMEWGAPYTVKDGLGPKNFILAKTNLSEEVIVVDEPSMNVLDLQNLIKMTAAKPAASGGQ